MTCIQLKDLGAVKLGASSSGPASQYALVMDWMNTLADSSIKWDTLKEKKKKKDT